MRHDSKGKTRDIISMEEYLKKRQAINPTEHTKKEGQPIEEAVLHAWSSSFFRTRAMRIIPYRSTGISMVAPMDAFSIISAQGAPIRAKMRVQTYNTTRRTAPIRANIRFSFCMINPFFCF